MARDAAALLPDCIASVRDEVLEVLVVDNGSRDDTVAVAERAGARIVPSAEPSHELARNAYLEAARTPWVFVLDADERLATPGLACHIERGASGHAIERYDWIGEGRWASTRLVRLFRNDPGIRYFPSTAHAAVAPHIDRIALADVVVHHLDALVARDHRSKRAGMRARLEAELATGRAPPILRCFYALELFAIDDDAGAERELARALAESTRAEPIVSLFRAQQHRARGRFEEAERLARHALALESDVFRGRDGAWAVLADALDRQGRGEEALACVRAAIAESPRVTSHRVNLAVLLGEDPLRHHPGRGDPRVFAPGARPSIFTQQDALLGRYRA